MAGRGVNEARPVIGIGGIGMSGIAELLALSVRGERVGREEFRGYATARTNARHPRSRRDTTGADVGGRTVVWCSLASAAVATRKSEAGGGSFR